MRFNCGPSYAEKMKAREQWHRWYAWRPVSVASRDCRWLEYVERKITYKTWGEYREYRALKGKSDDKA